MYRLCRLENARLGLGVLAGPGTPRDPKSHLIVSIASPFNRFAQSRQEKSQNFGADLAR